MEAMWDSFKRVGWSHILKAVFLIVDPPEREEDCRKGGAKNIY